MNTNQNKVGSGFWLGWFCASVMGYGGGVILAVSTAYGLFREDFDVLQGITIGLIAGVLAGFLQGIVLREHMARSGLWVPATAAGLAAGFGLAVVGSGGDPAKAGLLIAGLAGIGSGVLQWLVLRRAGIPRAGWWIPANLLALLTFPIGVRLVDIISKDGNYILGLMVLGLLVGAGIGAINGALLLWLLRQSPSGDAEGLAAAD